MAVLGSYKSKHTGQEIDNAVDNALNAVPNTRLINGKSLKNDITLNSNDIGAVAKSQGETNKNKVLLTDSSGNVSLVDKVPSTNIPSTGVSVETAMNLELNDGTILSADDFNNNIDTNATNISNIQNGTTIVGNAKNVTEKIGGVDFKWIFDLDENGKLPLHGNGVPIRHAVYADKSDKATNSVLSDYAYYATDINEEGEPDTAKGTIAERLTSLETLSKEFEEYNPQISSRPTFKITGLYAITVQMSYDGHLIASISFTMYLIANDDTAWYSQPFNINYNTTAPYITYFQLRCQNNRVYLVDQAQKAISSLTVDITLKLVREM